MNVPPIGSDPRRRRGRFSPSALAGAPVSCTRAGRSRVGTRSSTGATPPAEHRLRKSRLASGARRRPGRGSCLHILSLGRPFAGERAGSPGCRWACAPGPVAQERGRFGGGRPSGLARHADPARLFSVDDRPPGRSPRTIATPIAESLAISISAQEFPGIRPGSGRRRRVRWPPRRSSSAPGSGRARANGPAGGRVHARDRHARSARRGSGVACAASSALRILTYRGDRSGVLEVGHRASRTGRRSRSARERPRGRSLHLIPGIRGQRSPDRRKALEAAPRAFSERGPCSETGPWARAGSPARPSDPAPVVGAAGTRPAGRGTPATTRLRATRRPKRAAGGSPVPSETPKGLARRRPSRGRLGCPWTGQVGDGSTRCRGRCSRAGRATPDTRRCRVGARPVGGVGE